MKDHKHNIPVPDTMTIDQAWAELCVMGVMEWEWHEKFREHQVIVRWRTVKCDGVQCEGIDWEAVNSLR